MFVDSRMSALEAAARVGGAVEEMDDAAFHSAREALVTDIVQV